MDEHDAGPRFATMADALQARAAQGGQRMAFAFARQQSAARPELEELTFAGLLARSEVVGAALEGCCDQGARVLILAPPGLDYIVAVYGCLIAGRVAVPAYPPRNARNIDRLTTMAGDCGAALVLTTADLIERVAQWGGGRLPEMVALDRLSADSAAGWRAPQVDPESLAILQYTSGTTGSPKGVMVSHANVTATLSAAELRFDLRPEDKLVTWLPPYHDFGLIGATLQPVFSGFPAVALSPAAFLQDPGIWLRTISEQRGTLTLGPNFGFELLCEAKLGDTSALDLSQLRAAAQGGEPARAATMRRFAQRFAPFGFRTDALRSGYGLAEATLNVAIPRAARPGQPPLVLLGDRRTAIPPSGVECREAQAVSNGPPVAGMEVRIVDPVTRRQLLDGNTGEIWIAGSAVAQGYWRQPEASEATFRARLANEPAAGPFLRSGDLGTVVDGELFILGRIKELIILRGRNHHPQDIEAAVQACHPSLQPESTIAFGVEEGHEERLVVVHGLSRSAMRALDAPALFAAIRRAVIEAHEVDPFAIVLVQPAALPRTTSGKLQRLKAREMYLAGSLAAVASWRADAVDEHLDAAANEWREKAQAGAGATALPRSETEAMLCALFTQLTGKPEVGLHESFFDIGGDSLGAMTLVAALQRRTGRELLLRELYAHPTPAALAERLAPGAAGRVDATPAVPRSREGLAVPLAPIPAGLDTRPILFCFHAVPGTVVEHVALGLLLPEFRSIAIQARGLLAGRPAETDLLAQVETYATVVTDHAPAGPYRFIGRGTGGVLALEVLRTLRPEPAPEDCLVIVDGDPSPTEPGELPGSFDAFLLRSQAGLGARTAGLLAAVARLVPVRVRVGLVAAAMRRQLGGAPSLPGLPEASPEFVGRMRQVAQAQLAMLAEQWRPQPYAGRALLVTATGDPADRGHGWAKLLPGLKRASVVGTRRTIGSSIPQREIAALVREAVAGASGSPDAGYNPLLPLQPGGAQAPLFCVHPLIGRSLIFRRLAEALRPDIPVWGIETRGGEPGETPFADMATMTAAYLQAIRTVQPQGPFHLAGHSVGGVIAQEMACRLEAEGETVAHVAMFDTPLPSSFAPDRIPDRHDIVRAVAKTLDLPNDPSVRATEDVVTRLLDGLVRAGHVPAGTGVDWLTARIDAGVVAGRALFAICARHAPRVCTAPIVMFRAVEETEFPGDEAFDWSGLTRQGVARVDLPANHNRVLEPPCAAMAATHLSGRPWPGGATT